MALGVPADHRRVPPGTLRANFALFEKYPHYIFNFSGANRYRMIKEYYPAGYEQLKRYVAAGRWFPAGSSMEEGDVNSPSAESILRQVLYGNEFFRNEFGKASAEYMLPDCFGFPASLPSLLAHAGIQGFSTQKLTWSSAAPVGGPGSEERTPQGIPFNVGFWQGPDGRGVVAALNPGSYDSDILTDLSKSNPSPRGAPLGLMEWPVSDWPARLQLDGKTSGLFVDYRYYGNGDRGGSPSEPSVMLLDAIENKGLASLPRLPEDLESDEVMAAPNPAGPMVRVGDGPVRVVSATAEQMFLDIAKSGQASNLPRYQGDLELTNHSAGSLTSQAIHKRWNHKNERLAASAESASVAATWLGGRPYPFERLNRAWALVMGGQFHDILAGTATPEAYEYSWNDDVLAMNQFADVLVSATDSVASALDTRVRGTAVVVFNPLSVDRDDVVEATVSLPEGSPRAVRVTGPDGKDVPAQLEGGAGRSTKVVFLARVPSVGFAVYDVQAAEGPVRGSELRVDDRSLENARYRIHVDEDGDVSSVFDKILQREILSAPARLALQQERPRDFPAWNMDWQDQQRPPRGYVHGPAMFRVVENGPARVALEVERQAEGSRFIQTIRLAAGDAGNRVEFAQAIDWKTGEAALKATFPLSAANREATYALGAGTIRRGNNDARSFEVASHQWFDLTDQSGAYGTTVLSDGKTGSDKPDDHTLRLTLLYTPGLRGFFEGVPLREWGYGQSFTDQASQDWGHHELLYGLASHAGDWRQAETDWQAERLDDPLVAFESPRHAGALGKTFSLLGVSSAHARVMALKRAEESSEVVIRVVETRGQPVADLRLSFAAPLAAAREVDGQERTLGTAEVSARSVVTSLAPYQIRSFAVTLTRAPAELTAPVWQPVPLSYNLATASRDRSRSTGGFSSDGHALPAEMLPTELEYRGIRFRLAPASTEQANAVVARGQAISLPKGHFNRLYLLAASADGDQTATFHVGGQPVDLTIQDWSGLIGQWDTRSWTMAEVPMPPAPAPGDRSPMAPLIRRMIRQHSSIRASQVRGPDARLHQARPGGVVRLASALCRRSQRAVRLLLPLRVRGESAGGRQDRHPPRQ